MAKQPSRLLPQNNRAVALMLGLLVIVPALVGCGGLDQDDLRRRAIRRAPDPEDEERKVAKAQAPAPAQQATPEVAAVAAGGGTADVSQTVSAQASPEVSADEKDRPEEGLGPIPADLNSGQRALRSLKNLKRIAAAIEAYREQEKRMPHPGYPGLSWRVRLLPYLGYENLYARFKQDEPWFSEHNQALLAEIPPVYQSPERRDSRTNYQLVTGRNTVFGDPERFGDQRYRPARSGRRAFTVVEVDEGQEVNWTEPRDFVLDHGRGNTVPQGIGGLRDDGFFAVDGQSEVRWMPLQPTGPFKLREYFDYDKEDTGPDAGRVAKSTQALWYEAELAAAESPVASRGGAKAPETGTSGSGVAGSSSRGADGLGGQAWQAASVAAQAGDTASAWRWARGAVVAGVDAAQWSGEYLWYAALKRPSLGLKVAVALPGQPDRRGSTGRATRGDAGRRQFLARTGRLGEMMLTELEELASVAAIAPVREQADPSTQLVARSPRGAAESSSPMLFVLDAPSASSAVEKAREAGADVLVFFQFLNVAGGRGAAGEIQVLDLFRGRRLLKTDRAVVRSATAEAERVDENLKRLRWELKDFFEDNLTPQEWPVRMTPKMARNRLKTLASRSGRAMPLVALTEMRHYRQQGLIDDAELLAGAEGVLGKSDALALVLGDDSKQRRVLREWLPTDDPAEYVALVERQRFDRDED